MYKIGYIEPKGFKGTNGEWFVDRWNLISIITKKIEPPPYPHITGITQVARIGDANPAFIAPDEVGIVAKYKYDTMLLSQAKEMAKIIQHYIVLYGNRADNEDIDIRTKATQVLKDAGL